MPSAKSQSLPDLANLFDLLSDQTRLIIVLLLTAGDRNVTSLIKVLKMRQPSVSHHLGLLRMAGMIVGTRKGKEVIYSLADHIKVSSGKMKIFLPPHTVTVEGF